MIYRSLGVHAAAIYLKFWSGIEVVGNILSFNLDRLSLNPAVGIRLQNMKKLIS
jgi:hypothetical protein